MTAFFSTRAAVVTAGTVCVLFAMSDDFHLRHLLQIDSAEFNFRQGMNEAQTSHYYTRHNLRSVADALEGMRQQGDIVAANIVGLDFYYSHVDITYIDESNSARLYDWSCQRGTIDRWSNLPLIYRLDALGALTQSNKRVLLAIENGRYKKLRQRMLPWSPQILWQTSERDVVLVGLTKPVS